jgi:hypothetical protein
MGFMDKVGNAANVAKWKADQQLRIIKKQGEIRDIENNFYRQKVALSEVVYSLFKNNQIVNEEVLNICSIIAQIEGQIQTEKQNVEAIKQEQPPIQVFEQPPEIINHSGLICPDCGQQLVGKFCPVHGVEGVPPPNSSGLVCPICGKALVGKFCPKDGVEGVTYQR